MHLALAFEQCIMHSLGRRTHCQIISSAGPSEVSRLLESNIHTVKSWAARDSIPAEYWSALAAAGIATLDELAAAASRRHAQKEAA